MYEHFGSSVMANTKQKSADVKPCPTCGGPAIHEVRPFCSKRCAEVDLGRWLQGVYAIPSVDSADEGIIEAKLALFSKIGKADPNEDCG